MSETRKGLSSLATSATSQETASIGGGFAGPLDTAAVPDPAGTVAQTAGAGIGDTMTMVGTVTGLAQDLQNDPLQALNTAMPLAGQMGVELPQWVQGATRAAGLVQSLAKGDLGTALPDLPGIAGIGEGTTPGFNPGTAGPQAVLDLVPDEHPLGGQAITDFTAPAEFYAPPQLDPAALASPGPDLLDDSERLLKLYSPLSGEKRLYLASLQGTAALSDLYGYRLQLLSYDAAIDLQEVMGKNFTATVELADGSQHPINGYVTAFGFSHTDGGLAVYTAEITPWLWYLGKRINSRIFQDVSVLDVVDKVFADYGGLPDYEFRVNSLPQPETYIVQYDESDLNFISRLLERNGLFYYFEHRMDGHTLVISDSSVDAASCPQQQAHPEVRFNGGDRVIDHDTLHALSAHREVQPSVVALNTFKYADPYGLQYVEQPTVTRQGDVPKLKVYHGNPAYTHRDKEAGDRDAQRLMESYEWQAKLFHARTDCRGMVVGHTFRLLEHHWFDDGDPDDANFLVVGAQIDARNNFEQRDGGGDVYENSLTLIRHKIPYRPVQVHAKPAMKGPQTATVVGPAGKEIHTDKYGRIKVQFPWDLEGRHNEASSCWIRVSQPWAGRGWGTLAIPRIGQEVIIDYLEGDPDRPVCTGRLFNAEQGVPLGMPDGAHTMGFISNSTPGGGGQCRMLIRDQAGEELIDLFSQKDMTTETLNDHHTTVRGPSQTNTVTTGAQTNTVKKSIVNVAQTEHMVNVAHTHMVMAAKTDYMGLLAKQAVTIQSTDDLLGALAKKAVVVKSESDCICLEAATAIVLKVGASSITLTQDGGIFIEGVLVQVKGSQSIDLNP